MKKSVLFLVAVVILATVLPVTAFARGGRGYGGRVNASGIPRYAICTVDNCEVYGPHEHDGKWYCNQSGVNLNNYAVCPLEGCTLLGLHEHDGTWYHCANFPSGGGCCGGRGRYWL